MSELGDLLELMHGARRRWSTVRLVLRRWNDTDLGRLAMERGAEKARTQGAGVSILRVGARSESKKNDPYPETYESVSRMWLDPPQHRFRVERSDPHGNSVFVQVGEHWWSYHPNMGATSNEGDTSIRAGGSEEVSPLLDPALVVGILEFDITGEREHHGRSSIVVRATSREVEERARFGHYMPDADEFELLVDAEVGVLLRIESFIDGQPFMILELTDVQFEEPFAEDLFVFRAPPGESIRSTRDVFNPPRGMSIEEAARSAPFTVLSPQRLPEGWRLNVAYTPGQDRPFGPPTVVMHLHDPTGLHQLRIMQGAQPLDDGLDWTEVDFEGEQFLMLEQTGMLDGQIELKLERHGTHARLTGDVDRDAMLRIARSLHPASPNLPPLVQQ